MYFIAGPCSLEGLDQVKEVATTCKKLKVKYFRAQIFKPRTYPESFQGLGEAGLPLVDYLLQEGFVLVSEAASLEQLNIVKNFAAIIQIGARNMQNFELLKSLGSQLNKDKNQKIMLKRGFANTLNEWLASARYLEKGGIPKENIILCERGSRSAQSPTGVTLDLALAFKAKNEGYQVIIDPSHGSKDSTVVLPLTKAALAMNFDGVMVEIHPRPQESWSDAHQAVGLEEFEKFVLSETSTLGSYLRVMH